MKLFLSYKVPNSYERTAIASLIAEIERQVNGLTEGRIAVRHGAYSSMPTSGGYVQGDFVPNSLPIEIGAEGNRYVINGWLCTASDPLTFVEQRFLTGS